MQITHVHEAEDSVCRGAAAGLGADKTPWLRRLWEDGHAVTVVSRPPGFGKTLLLT